MILTSCHAGGSSMFGRLNHHTLSPLASTSFSWNVFTAASARIQKLIS